jgi:hypothetical protein
MLGRHQSKSIGEIDNELIGARFKTFSSFKSIENVDLICAACIKKLDKNHLAATGNVTPAPNKGSKKWS